MTEKDVQSQLQNELLTLTTLFSTGDVVINDWSVLDGPTAKAPFVIIEDSGTVEVGNPQVFSPTTWVLPFTIVVAFRNWAESLNSFRDTRQAVLSHLQAVDSFAGVNGALAVGIREIRSQGEILSVFLKYTEDAANALPTFLAQDFILTISEPI
jgi:hypothetical protein